MTAVAPARPSTPTAASQSGGVRPTHEKAIRRTRSLIVQVAIAVDACESEGTRRDALEVLRQCVRLYRALQGERP